VIRVAVGELRRVMHVDVECRKNARFLARCAIGAFFKHRTLGEVEVRVARTSAGGVEVILVSSRPITSAHERAVRERAEAMEEKHGG